MIKTCLGLTVSFYFCKLILRNVSVWFNVFTFHSKFCELTRRNVRVWVNVFMLSIFSRLRGSSLCESPKST
ncbi:hypothetical protein Hanom_Chr10g00880121 [Helianthus anomalus]